MITTNRFTRILLTALCLFLWPVTATTATDEVVTSNWPSPIPTLGYPQFVNYGSANTHWIRLSNPEPIALEIVSITPLETNYSSESWLSVSPTALSIPPTSSDSFSLTITATPYFTAGSNWWLNGRVLLHTPGNTVESTYVNIIDYVVTDTVVGLFFDTLVTCGVSLVVDNHGNLGGMGKGGVNMDFTGVGECNPEADVYLFDGGPIVIRKNGSDYVYANGLYQDGFEADQAWKPIAGTSAGSSAGLYYNSFFTGTMVNRDTSIGINIHYYAPTGGGDSCDFIFQQMKVFKMTPGTFTGVTIGQAIDWDIWSDLGANHNLNRTGVSLDGFVYQHGLDSGSVSGCNPDSGRFGAQVMLGYYTVSDSLLSSGVVRHEGVGSYIQFTDSVMKYDTLSENAEAAWYWNEMANPGLQSQSGIHDFSSVSSFVFNNTLSSDDTLTCWSVLTTVRSGTLTDLEENLSAATSWFYTYLRPFPCGCCIGDVGNVDNSFDDGVDIGDLTALINNLFVTFEPIPCPSEANCDGDLQGNIDIGDLTALIEHLFMTFTPLPICGGC